MCNGDRLYIVVFWERGWKVYISEVGFFSHFFFFPSCHRHLVFSPSHPLKQTGRKKHFKKINQIRLSKGKMLPTVKQHQDSFSFCLGGRLLVWTRVFSQRCESGALCCPSSQSSARLGPPCACMTWKYIFCCACRSIFEIILLFTHGWWC